MTPTQAPADGSAPIARGKLGETIRVLAEDIGPRGSTTAAERRAAEWAAQRLGALGIAVRIEPFRSVPTFSWAFGLFFLVFVLAVALYPLNAWLGAALALAALVAFALESSTIATVTRVLPQFPSQNVVGTLHARGQPQRRLVLCAHLDSTRSAIVWHPRLVSYFHPLLLFAVACMAVETLSLWYGATGGAAWAWNLAVIAALPLALLVLMFLNRELGYALVPGANDNASGVAAALAVAQALVTTPLERTEVMVLLSGCEEAGTVGMLRFLEAHPELDKRRTLFLNFDNIGAGDVVYTTGEGILFTLPCDREMVAAAAAVRDLRARPFVYKTLTTDNTAVLSKGYRGLSLMAVDARGVLPHWHWRTDTVANIDLRTVQTAAELGLAIARRLDRGARGGA